jgi:prepilin-type N-terminal cleavage/methylation domain-containing protein
MLGMRFRLINKTRRYEDSPLRKELMASRKTKGYSLLEMIITVSIALILAGVTFISFQPMMNQGHTNSAYDTTLMALRNTRNLAITQSHEYYVNFHPSAGFPGTIQVQYQPPTVGAGAAPPAGASDHLHHPLGCEVCRPGGIPRQLRRTGSAPVSMPLTSNPLAGVPELRRLLCPTVPRKTASATITAALSI